MPERFQTLFKLYLSELLNLFVPNSFFVFFFFKTTYPFYWSLLFPPSLDFQTLSKLNLSKTLNLFVQNSFFWNLFQNYLSSLLKPTLSSPLIIFQTLSLLTGNSHRPSGTIKRLFVAHVSQSVLQIYLIHKKGLLFWYSIQRTERNVMQIEICFGYISIQIVFNHARIRLVLQHLVLTGTTFSNHCKPHFRWLWRQNIKLSRIW